MPAVVRQQVWYVERPHFGGGSYVWFYPRVPRPYGKDLKTRLGSVCYKYFTKAFGVRMKCGECVKVTLKSGSPFVPKNTESGR